MVDNWIFVSTLLIVQLGLHKLCFWYHLEPAPKLMNKLFDHLSGQQDPVFDLSFSCWLRLNDSRTYVTFVFIAILLHNNIQCQISYFVLFLTVLSNDQNIFFIPYTLTTAITVSPVSRNTSFKLTMYYICLNFIKFLTCSILFFSS